MHGEAAGKMLVEKEKLLLLQNFASLIVISAI
jgi:hypothetical protein